jgi:hypothetical protein
MFRCADFRHQCVTLNNIKSRHFELKTLANMSFYTTAGVECLDVLSLNINVSLYTAAKSVIFDIKTLANLSFYTTAGADIFDLLT